MAVGHYENFPVASLLLPALYRRNDDAACAQSDAICSTPQLITFWQDVARDHATGRIYIPQSELRRFGITAENIGSFRADARWRALMRALTAHARAMLSSGAPLAHALGGCIGFELRLVVQGGMCILERIDAVDGDVFTRRPALRPTDWLLLGVRALRMLNLQ